jgi:DNA-binding GntR family transcriptional regulator
MMPVREAVSRLVADGALEVTPNRAVRVRLMTAAQFRDLTQARIIIEGHVAAAAASNRTDSDLKSIARAEAAMRTESRAAKPNLPRAVEHNKSFHFAVYEAAHSATLLDIIRALWLKAGPVINLDLRANPERLAKGDAIRFHAKVLAAIKAGDEAGAREGIAGDIGNAAEVILARGGLAE